MGVAEGLRERWRVMKMIGGIDLEETWKVYSMQQNTKEGIGSEMATKVYATGLILLLCNVSAWSGAMVEGRVREAVCSNLAKR